MVEWAADQPWSTGKVGLTGISYLGLNQVSAHSKWSNSLLGMLTFYDISGLLPHANLVVLPASFHGKACQTTIETLLDTVASTVTA